MMDYIVTYNSIKDEKLKKAVVKKVENMVVSDDGTTVKDLVKTIKALEAENLKLKDELYKSQSDNLSLFNKMNNTISILAKKTEKLENEVTTLLSINQNK